MRAGDGFFVDSNLLLYFVDTVELEKRARGSACAFDGAAPVRERLRTFETFGQLIVCGP